MSFSIMIIVTLKYLFEMYELCKLSLLNNFKMLGSSTTHKKNQCNVIIF